MNKRRRNSTVLIDDETTDDEITDEDHGESEGENYEISSLSESEDDDDSDHDIFQPSTSNLQRTRKRYRIDNEQKPSGGRPVSVLRGQGDNKIKWSLKPAVRRLSQTKKILHLPGVIGEACQAKTPIDTWSYLFSEDILDIIVVHTNEQIDRVCANMEQLLSYHNKTDIVEIKALIGLLYISGYRKQPAVNVNELWGEEFSVTIFKATMSSHRFQFLSKCLRFDDKNTRKNHRKLDRFALIREIWDKFITNCGKYYRPYEMCTLDEQMVGFKGRCIFRMYLPSKPDRYGIKFFMLNDSKTCYMMKAVPYLGKTTQQRNEPLAHFFVRELVEPIRDSNRTVVMDNWFTSIGLFQILLNEYNLKAIGTIRKNKKEIPRSFTEKAPPSTTKYCFANNQTLLSYVPKRNKIVLILSSNSTNTEIDPKTKKPKLILQYNQHKSGTDSFDQACKLYTVARRTRRWPLKVFYGMLNMANVNSTILYNLNHVDEKKTRLTFMKDLSFELIKPLLIRRHRIPQLRRNIKSAIAQLLNYETPTVDYSDVIPIPKTRCSYCHYSLGVKTTIMCPQCEKPMCKRHRCPMCIECCNENST
ncbi:piggyBac transposable element-derived protein 4-like isoform X1 [Venturia canescens]|uniref:piggyBac transposable element-derived protein 4-like isoform X1 n=1 Tax=Venturia canescens TaxID=32260 RepID=UPI001C9C55CD|nr:piggyBac transposable element-derived protein 4-like isoform X1 [Venturia canescens]XP_043288322.1 piggyBac transposable element-derived protein 4-like isoform X1 [Venturia canescens]XP_043288324.1 piggyBac transposable element-derived protein 4-like isoform X1 [Venturia canescens]